MAFTYDLATDSGKVRLLLNDVDSATAVFTDAEITAFLAVEASNVKRAAAQAIDTNADNEVLASKVLRTPELTTDGAKVADALHKRAAELRRQADESDDDASYAFDVVEFVGCVPELAEYPYY